MAWLIWKDLTYPLNSNCYCSLHTVTESLDQKSAGPRVMCEKRKVLTFQAWVSVHLTLWGSHARWRVAFIVTKTNAGQTDRLTSHGHFKFVPQSHFHKRFFESSMLWFSSTVRYKQSSKLNYPEKVSESRRKFDQLGWPDDQRQHHFSLWPLQPLTQNFLE